MSRFVLKISILVVLLVACALPALHGFSRGASADNVVTLRFWNGFTGPDGRTMLAIVRRFNEANPDVHVVMQRMPWATYYNKLFVAGLGNRAPEVFVLHSSSITRFLRAKFLRPMDDLTGSGPGFIDASDFDPNVWQAAGDANGTHWGIPLDCHMLGMYYNRKLFREAGIEHPPTNREEFIDALRRLKKPAEGGRPAQWGLVYTWLRTNGYALMRQYNGGFYDAAQDRLTIASPENEAALDFAASLVKQELVPSPEHFDAWVGFLQGNVAMCFEGIYMLPDLQRQGPSFEWGAAPVPQLGPTQATWGESHSLCLRADLEGKELEASKRFVKFLSDNSLDWAEGGQVPVRRSLRNTERFEQMTAQREFAKQIPYASYFPQIPYLLELLPEFDYAVEMVMRDKATGKQAMEECARRMKPVYERYQRGAGMSERRRAGSWSGYLFLAPYLLIFTVFLLLPLLYGLALSFMQYEMVSPLPRKFIGLANYAEAFHDDRFWESLWATLRFVLMCVPTTLVLAMLLAVALDAVSPRRMGFYRLAIFLPTMITISVAALVWRWFFNSEFGVFNSILHVHFPWITDTRWAMPSLVLMTIWWTVGAPTLILLAGLRQIPPAYHEAAALDGATGVECFFLITLPLLRPVLLFVLVTYTIGAFQVFGQPMLITQGGGPEMSTRVLVEYIYETAFNSFRMGYGAAMSWLLFLVIAGISALLFRTQRGEE